MAGGLLSFDAGVFAAAGALERDGADAFFFSALLFFCAMLAALLMRSLRRVEYVMGGRLDIVVAGGGGDDDSDGDDEEDGEEEAEGDEEGEGGYRWWGEHNNAAWATEGRKTYQNLRKHGIARKVTMAGTDTDFCPCGPESCLQLLAAGSRQPQPGNANWPVTCCIVNGKVSIHDSGNG